ncbi:MAG: hypothetical protein ACRC62_12150 [Microcoleus sp.]
MSVVGDKKQPEFPGKLALSICKTMPDIFSYSSNFSDIKVK